MFEYIKRLSIAKVVYKEIKDFLGSYSIVEKDNTPINASSFSRLIAFKIDKILKKYGRDDRQNNNKT
jgi:hypothetical protein